MKGRAEDVVAPARKEVASVNDDSPGLLTLFSRGMRISRSKDLQQALRVGTAQCGGFELLAHQPAVTSSATFANE